VTGFIDDEYVFEKQVTRSKTGKIAMTISLRTGPLTAKSFEDQGRGQFERLLLW
jgi:hypothetical protein